MKYQCSKAIKLRFGSFLALMSFPMLLKAQTTLYDSAGGLTPDQSPYNWTYQAIGPASASFSYGATLLDTTSSDAIQAGYARFTPFSMNASLGYSVRFDLKVVSEDHSNTLSDKNSDGLSDRAGVSVIVLGSNHTGVELGFWQNEVWAQQSYPLFTHSQTAERGFINATSNGNGFDNLNRFDLVVSSTGYSLFANGSTLALISGQLKDYSAGPAIYSQNNFLFVGDNNTTSRGSFFLSHVEATSAPELSSGGIFVCSLLSLPIVIVLRKQKRVKSRII